MPETTVGEWPSSVELGRLGPEVYQRDVKPRLAPEDHGKFVAVEPLSGDYEVNASDHLALEAMRARHPGRRLWLECAGYPTAYAFAGGRPL